MSATRLDLTVLGPFFAAEVHRADRAQGGPPPAPWRPLTDLVDDPAILDRRVAATRAHLGGDRVEPRVAASVTHLGLAARLVGPFFALAVLTAPGDGADVKDLWWQDVPGSTFPLSLPDSALAGQATGTHADPVALAAAAILRPVTAIAPVFADRYGVNPHILLGNAASALGGATSALSAVRPDLAPIARAFLTALAGTPLLRPAAAVTASGRLRRTSCCLIYRAAPDRRPRPPALCGDCCLAGPAVTRDAQR